MLAQAVRNTQPELNPVPTKHQYLRQSDELAPQERACKAGG